MNYNPYSQYPYNNYVNGNVMQQQYTPNQYQQQYNQGQQMQQNQMSYLTSIVVNGYADVEKYIVAPNQTINFYDSKNGYFYLKSADGMGKYNIKVFKLTETNIDDIINPKVKNENQNNNNNYLTANDLTGYVTIEDFNRLEREFKKSLENITQQISNINNNRTNNRNYKKDSE